MTAALGSVDKRNQANSRFVIVQKYYLYKYNMKTYLSFVSYSWQGLLFVYGTVCFWAARAKASANSCVERLQST